MTYQVGGLIEATDYNNFVGPDVSSAINKFNTIWSTGSGSYGYGQPALTNETVGNTITATSWATLVQKLQDVNFHQGSASNLPGYTVFRSDGGLAQVNAPVQGKPINYLPYLSTGPGSVISNLTEKRLWAGIQGGSLINSSTFSSTWSSALTFTHTVTFASGDHARYFFNSGGQLRIYCNFPYVPGIPLSYVWKDLAQDFSSVYISSPSSGNVKINYQNNSTNIFTGATQKGFERDEPAIVSTNSGYYGLSTANTTIATQYSNDMAAPWVNQSYIRLIAKTNGTQGSNGDTGSVITLYTVWDLVPKQGIVGTGAQTYVQVIYPSTKYLANTWGAVTLSSTVSGQ